MGLAWDCSHDQGAFCFVEVKRVFVFVQTGRYSLIRQRRALKVTEDCMRVDHTHANASAIIGRILNRDHIIAIQTYGELIAFARHDKALFFLCINGVSFSCQLYPGFAVRFPKNDEIGTGDQSRKVATLSVVADGRPRCAKQ